MLESNATILQEDTYALVNVQLEDQIILVESKTKKLHRQVSYTFLTSNKLRSRKFDQKFCKFSFSFSTETMRYQVLDGLLISVKKVPQFVAQE